MAKELMTVYRPDGEEVKVSPKMFDRFYRGMGFTERKPVEQSKDQPDTKADASKNASRKKAER